MPVHRRRELRVVVPELVLDEVHRLALREQQRRVRVPQRVRRDVPEPEPFRKRDEELVKPPVLHRLRPAPLVGEHPRPSAPLVVERDDAALAVELAERLAELRGEVHAPRLAALRRRGALAAARAPDRGDALEASRGGRLLLVFSDPTCGPCDQLAPKLADPHRRHAGNGFSILMVGRGDAQENRRKAKEHGLEFPVVVQDRWKLSKEYGTFATPVAFLIGKDGIIEQNVAQGPEQILALAEKAASAGKESSDGRLV